MKHRTPRGAWNKPQLELLGIEWPPRQGWIDRAEGMEIPEAIAERFAALSTLKHKSTRIETLPPDDEQPQPRDKHVEAVKAKLRDRMRAGLRKYGVTTERTDLTRKQWLIEAQNEAMDLAVYLERLIQEET